MFWRLEGEAWTNQHAKVYSKVDKAQIQYLLLESYIGIFQLKSEKLVDAWLAQAVDRAWDS